MSDQNEQSPSQETHDLPNVDLPVDPVIANEKAAFNRYVQDQGSKIPPNFKSADDWFNSLLEARGQYTKARQEVSDLKKQYNQNANQNPSYKEPVASDTAPIAPPVVDISNIPDELKIPDASVKAPEVPTSVSHSEWVSWGAEIDKTGDLSPATRAKVKAKMGVDDVIVSQMVLGRQAAQKEAFNKAADVVGGGDSLKHLFEWARTTLPKSEVDALNVAMQTSAYPSVLLGLKQRMENTKKAPLANREPKVPLDRVNVGRTPEQVQVFTSISQQNATLRDPRYRTDPKFREAAERMMINTNKHGFKGT